MNDKLDTLSGLEEPIVRESRTKLATEDTIFRNKLSEITNNLSGSPVDVRRAIYRLQSELVFCIDSWNKYLAEVKRKPKTKPAAYASSEILGSTPDDSPATLSPKNPEKKGHRRVHSDGYLSLNIGADSKPFNGRRSLYRSAEDLLSQKKDETDGDHDDNGGALEKSCEHKPDDLKHGESRFSKMAYNTKKLFKAFTDSYKKIEVGPCFLCLF